MTDTASEATEAPRARPPRDMDEEQRLLGRLGKLYVRREEDRAFEDLLRDMVVRTLAGREGRAAILAAPSGAGKTTLVAHAAERVPGLSIEGSKPGMLFVQVPSPCSLASLGSAVATAAGLTVRAGLKAPAAWDAAWRTLRTKNIRFLWLDEVHNITEVASSKEGRKIRNTVKTAMINQRHTMGLVLSGDVSIASFLREDRHVLRRSDVFSIAEVGVDGFPMLESTIRRLAEKVGMRTARNLRREIVPRLLHASLKQFGTAVERARFTIVRAATEGGASHGRAETLTLEHFATDWARSTGADATRNPFVARNWLDLDVAAILRGDAPASVVRPRRPKHERERGD